MSYLQKLAELQQKSQEAKKQDAMYKESLRQDAFTTAEAKKDDYLGALSRHLEDANNKIETAMGLAQTTSAIAKHTKKIREAFKEKKPTVTRDDSLRPTAPDASASADASSAPRPTPTGEPPIFEPGSGIPPPPPRSAPGFAKAPVDPRFASRPAVSTQPVEIDAGDVSSDLARARSVTPAGQALRQFDETAGTVRAPGSEKTVTFEQQRPTAEQLEEDPFQPTAGQPVRSATLEKLRQKGAGKLAQLKAKVQTPEQSAQLGKVTNQKGNLSTEADTQSAESRLVPESSRSAPAPTPESGGGGGGALTQELEEGAGTLLKTDAPEMATNLIGDTLLSSIPIVGEIATGASLIGSLIEDIKAHSAEKKAEETMTPDAERGTAVASTGFDGEALKDS